MEAIGGYFSLELPIQEEFHKNSIRLNTGRNCLEYILRARGYKKLYVPYYTCEAVIEPINKLGIQSEFYHINIHFEIKDHFRLKDDEALLYTNYFGLKQRYVEQLAEKTGSRLIVDNTQAFYAKPLQGIDTFYTCRKFFGVADGAYLYTDMLLDDEFVQDKSYDRMAHLLKRIDLSAEQGYVDFQKVDDGLDNQPIRKMSKLTQRIMQSIDYDAVAKKRRENFLYLNKSHGRENNLKLSLDKDAVPMAYPFLAPIKGLREKLIENKIFVARYWPNVLNWTTKDDVEYFLAYQLQPLPIDQRYDKENMKRIIEIVKQYPI
ncbi:hypothetical protein C7Y71_010570 [Pseudoprevotella muciniphila]|uniref:DegT/DnrJ/EryC1/StrS aminotransferase family protein n=1 Tax=Pseudoprevotella muciniphila TaxID=2133944 RepID=A0A5P8E8Y9_9BACT|nr:hypothetical protein [Pseudoprevotella muciniphila]QFQ13418.1 hypothetical protein C7Y71_010570 [Pseudoprevotella muciniphila]